MLELIRHGAILEIRLNHPPANALDPATVQELRRQIEQAPAQNCSALVLSGKPGMFSAGLDVPALLKLDRAGFTRFWNDFYALLNALATSRIPIAAALTGHAPAGGTVVAAFCDYRVIAEGDYKMGFSEVQVGLPVPRPVYAAFEHLCGPRIAALYAMEGRIMDGRHALEIGLVDELAPGDEVVERALAWCRKLLALPPNAVALTRECARAGLIASFKKEAVDVEAFVEGWFSRETQSVMSALVERLRARR